MKTVITLTIVGLAILLVAGSASAAIRLIKGTEIAQVYVHDSTDKIYLSKVVDGDTTCYVTSYGEFGAHAVSCVK